jgi:hypothetical protein
MKQTYQLRTKHKPQLLYAMMRALVGEDSRISFEGRLSNTDLFKIDEVHFEASGVAATLREIWTRMDQLLPGTYTGGLSGDTLVSAAGTLPLSTTAIYGHSFCMLKCPEAAVTLYAQSLESLRWMDHYQSEEYWVGSYGCYSRFVTLFQRRTAQCRFGFLWKRGSLGQFASKPNEQTYLQPNQ